MGIGGPFFRLEKAPAPYLLRPIFAFDLARTMIYYGSWLRCEFDVNQQARFSAL